MKDKTKVEVVYGNKYTLGESPFYDPRNKVLSWVDIVKGSLYIQDSHNRIKEINFKEKIGAAIPLKKSNGFFVCGTTGLYTVEDNSIKQVYNLKQTLEPFQRCNDAKADRMGRVWFTSIVDDDIHAPEGKLYCYVNKEVLCMDPDLRLGNGIAWNKDNSKMFLIDSVAHCIYSYDYDLDTGYITNKKVLCEIRDGEPDGMTIDTDDNLWIGIWDGSRIEVRSSRTGILKKTINMPTLKITSCAFDNDENILYATSAKSNDECGGSLFKIKVEAKGQDIDYAIID